MSTRDTTLFALSVWMGHRKGSRVLTTPDRFTGFRSFVVCPRRCGTLVRPPDRVSLVRCVRVGKGHEEEVLQERVRHSDGRKVSAGTTCDLVVETGWARTMY